MIDEISRWEQHIRLKEAIDKAGQHHTILKKEEGNMTNYKQIFIINNDLGMGKGKIAGQCCHGTVLYVESVLKEYLNHILVPLS